MAQRLRHLGQFTLTTAALRRDFSSNRRAVQQNTGYVPNSINFLDYSGSTRLAYERDILGQPSEEIALKRAEHSLAKRTPQLRPPAAPARGPSHRRLLQFSAERPRARN